MDWIQAGHGRADLATIPLKLIGTFSDLGAVIIRDGYLHQAIDQAENILLDRRPYEVFERGGKLFWLTKVRDAPSRAKDKVKRDPDSVILEPLSPHYLLDLLGRTMSFQKQDTEGSLRDVDPPMKLALRYLESSKPWGVHVLTSIIHAPTIWRDGTVVHRPGYDRATGLYFHPGKTKFESLPSAPKKDRAIKALRTLREPLAEFPWVDRRDDGMPGADEAVILSAILTALVRPSLDMARLHAITAPIMASGKTLLTDVISTIALGHPCAKISQPYSEEEEIKHLFSCLLAGDPIVCIDNVERQVKSATLSNMLTTRTYQGRILGKSKNVVVPTVATL